MSEAAGRRMTLAEFLDWAEVQDEPFEYVGGVPRSLWPHDAVTAVAGTWAHHELQYACARAIDRRRPQGCRVATGARVKLSDGSSRLPDVTLACGRRGEDKHHAADPTLLVEVLSPTTEAYDRGQKLDAYKAVESIAEIWLVDSERRRVTVWYRSREPGDAVWRAAEYIGNARLASPCLAAEIGLDEVYEDVEL